jgi:tetratricopeptide (TPR) repeat protein
LAINDGLQNPDRRELATNLNMLGIAYYRQGKFAKAEPLLKRALATIEIACGAERSERVILTDNLAGLYRDTGAWKKAERLYRCELAISEQAPASCPRKLAIILNDIGRVCFEQGKLVEAEALYRRALSMNEQAWKRDLASLRQMFGPNNPRVVTPGVGDLYIAPNLINLAKLYAKQGKYDEAEPLCKRALAIEEKECGFERGQAVNVYALIMRKTNRDSAAVEVEARYKAFQASCGTPKAP